MFAAAGEENLGIECLSAALKKAGHEVHLLLDTRVFSDPNSFSVAFLGRFFNFKKDFLSAFSALRPDLVCFSVNTSNYRWALDLAEALKASEPASFIVFGGVHCTAVPEAVIAEPAVDVCCVGEGDEALVELAGAVAAGADFSAIKNLWIKTKAGVIRNPVRPPITDLDSLPFPDKDLYYADYSRMFPGYITLASRGCLFSCSYCHNSVLNETYSPAGKYYRRRSPENVVRELEDGVARFSSRYVRFEDEVFTADKEWLREFLPLYRKRVGLPFDCSVHPRFVDEETLDLLDSSGCAVVRMGVQSLHEERRAEVLNRHYSNEEAARAIAGFRARGIFLACDNIFGIPGQDEAELRATAEFYLGSRPDYIAIHWLNYYPRTRITAAAAASGLIDSEMMGRIERGLADRDNVRGGISYKKEFVPYQLLLALVTLLPGWVSRFLLKNDRYKLLPAINPYLLMMLNRILSRPPFDIYPERTARRYLVSVYRRLFSLRPGFLSGSGLRR